MMYLWRPVFAMLLEATKMTLADIQQHVRDLHPEHADNLELLNEVLPLHLHSEPGPPISRNAASIGRSVLCESLLRCTVSKLKSVILVVEDLHWATSLSIRLLVAASKIEVGLMIVINSRPFSTKDVRILDYNRLRDNTTGVIKLGTHRERSFREEANTHVDRERERSREHTTGARARADWRARRSQRVTADTLGERARATWRAKRIQTQICS
jgi:hypothetical protein